MSTQAPQNPTISTREAPSEEPVTRAFLETLFASLREDLQEVKRDLTAEIKDIRKDVDDIGGRVATLEDRQDSTVSDLHTVHQEVIRLHDQQVDL